MTHAVDVADPNDKNETARPPWRCADYASFSGTSIITGMRRCG